MIMLSYNKWSRQEIQEFKNLLDREANGSLGSEDWVEKITMEQIK